MSCSSASPVVVNTIIAFNSSGLYKEGSAGTPLLRYNCVYGNGAYNYQGLADPTGTEGNLSVDPGLAAPFYENVHIQPDSPCVDAGDDGAVEAGWADMDCQTRILGSHVDIGADESDGTVWPSGSRRIIRVSPTGDDANDGSSWAAAKQTVQAAIDVAAVTGGEVWVAAGTYMENIDLKVSIYGGFAGHETDVSERDWQVNETVLDGNQANSVVIATPTVDPAVCIDGFTLRNGSGQPGEARYGGGIYCRVASPTIANNKIVGNSATGVSVGYGGAIYCSASSATIANNTIQGNNASSYGGGIACYQGSPKILSNTIAANSAARSGSSGGQGGGVHCLNASASIIGNTISANTSTGHGGAIYCTGGSVTIAGNAIAGNRATSTGGYGGGIYCTSSILIANNTILANGASKGGGIYFSSSPTIVNTIVAFNSSGICQYQAGTPVLSWNCVYGNTAYNYSGLPDPTGTNGSISADPLFVSASSGLDEIWGTADDTYADLRLLPWSPCIDAGSNTGVPADAADLDDDGDVTEPLPVDVTGQLRFLDDPQVADTGAGTPPIVDMGAYERGRPASDVDGDWLTDVVDLLYMVDAFGTYSGDADYDPRCDFNADGAVDVVDLLDIVYNFGK
jgi:predicted outer membrane repeat protein